MDEYHKTDSKMSVKPGMIKKSIEVSQAEYISIEEIFISNARAVVENNISNISFNVVLFAEQIGISQSTLYRRMNGLFNVSPQEYVHSVRLKHAKRMLIGKVGSVTAVAHAVGFSNPRYFTKCFRKFYGVAPSQLLKGQYCNHKNNV